MRGLVTFFCAFMLFSCTSDAPKINGKLLCRSWVFADQTSSPLVVSKGQELDMAPFDTTASDGVMGMQFAENGRLIMFKVVKGKKQNLNFIHGIWTVKEAGKIHMNLDGSLPVFKINVLTKDQLILEKDAVLAD